MATTAGCRPTARSPAGSAGSKSPGWPGLLDGADLVAPLGNGALPPECDTLLQELVIDDYTYVDQAAAYAVRRRPGCPGNAVAAA